MSIKTQIPPLRRKKRGSGREDKIEDVNKAKSMEGFFCQKPRNSKGALLYLLDIMTWTKNVCIVAEYSTK